MKVSIIVPIYKGSSYIDSILEQINRCAIAAKQVQLELILYNDYPEENISIESGEFAFDVCVVNSEHNRGIHGARVEALKYSTGEYVVFLDQDDKIAPTYIQRQLQSIGQADAVVCRAIHDGRLFYTDSHRFEEVVSKDFMFKKWDPIVSPGQVLIKKASIPEMWKTNIMKVNGADDYFLWLLMTGMGKQFALNQEVLFEHVVEGNNTSANTNQMMDSEQEMIQILLKSRILSEEDEADLRAISQSLRRVHVAQLDNYRMAYYVMNLWFDLSLEGKKPSLFLEKNNIKKIAIYGAGDVGKSIFKLLKESQIEVVFYIDRNAKYIQDEVPVYTLESAPIYVDAIVVSLFREVEYIEQQLQEKFLCPIYSISELLDRVNM